MDSIIRYTPNLNLSLLPANYRIWAQIMNDNLTTVDAAINAFVQFSSLRGAWTNSTHYLVGDTVVDSSTAVLWTSLIDHISATIPTTFTEDSLARPGTWILAAAPATQRGVWTPSTAYNVGDFVLADGVKFAMCNVQHVSGATFDADVALGHWTVLIDLSAAGSLVLPILSGLIDAKKFVSTTPDGTAYQIIDGIEAMARLEGVLPISKGGTGSNTTNGTGLPVFTDTPALTGAPTSPTPAYPSNTTQLATTEYVTTALAAGASISVGDTAPVGPAANQLWWNSNAGAGGGQLYIWYNDGSTTQWVPSSPAVTAPTAQSVGPNYLMASVPFTAAGPAVNGPSTGSIGAAEEKWEIKVKAGIANTAGGNNTVTAALHDGTAIIDDATMALPTGFSGTLSFSTIVLLTAPTTFTLQARGSAVGNLATTLFSTNKATSITAVRLS